MYETKQGKVHAIAQVIGQNKSAIEKGMTKKESPAIGRKFVEMLSRRRDLGTGTAKGNGRTSKLSLSSRVHGLEIGRRSRPG